MPDTATATARAPHAPTSLQVRVNQKVTLETLNTLVARIAGRTGCTTCGLLGVDLRITGDPVEADQFQLPGITSVNII